MGMHSRSTSSNRIDFDAEVSEAARCTSLRRRPLDGSSTRLAGGQAEDVDAGQRVVDLGVEPMAAEHPNGVLADTSAGFGVGNLTSTC